MKKIILLCLLSAASFSGCSSDNASNSGTSGTAPSVYYSEADYKSGKISSVESGKTIVLNLEPPGSAGSSSDTGGNGYDEFNFNLKKTLTVDLCVLANNRSFLLELFSSDNRLLSSMTSQNISYNCADDALPPVSIPSGEYRLRVTHDGKSKKAEKLFLTLKYASSAVNKSAASTVAADATLSLTTPPLYDITATYKDANTVVSYKDVLYSNGWWANPGNCPVKTDCPSTFADDLWKLFDPNAVPPSTKHEFAYYDYPAIVASYPKLATCTATDYSLDTVTNLIKQSATGSGEIALAAPGNGYTQQDLDALAREYMLPCQPDLSTFTPDNVATVKRVIPKDKWDTLAGNAYGGDSSYTYTTAAGLTPVWPAESGFKDNTYNNFLAAVARYPFFCGEKGYFSSTDEACKREIASLFGHAAQETGETQITTSFYSLRETGWVNQLSSVDQFRKGCGSPFDCSSEWAMYYGRGPKQLTYGYNYAGFSAAYFNGDYNFLLKWPDMVAYDGKMFFESAIWFVMTHQPPKPSIHDVMLGRYSPSTACKTTSDCFGLQYDDVTGVKNNFNVTIEVVNGGPECRGVAKTVQSSANRSNGFMQMLDLLDAKKNGSELNPISGCDSFIHNTDPTQPQAVFDTQTIFANSTLASPLSTWLEMSQSSCKAQARGGNAMISVTATGIVKACKGLK